MPDGMTVDYDGLIPNNVGLNDDARVRKALETWHPGYIDWWKDMGPEGFQDALVYLRTAVGVDPEGWARAGPDCKPKREMGHSACYAGQLPYSPKSVFLPTGVAARCRRVRGTCAALAGRLSASRPGRPRASQPAYSSAGP